MGQVMHGIVMDSAASLLLGATTLSFMLFFIGFILWMLPAARTAQFEAASMLPLEEE